MDEDSKKVLYKQLVEMYENNKNKEFQTILTEEEFLEFDADDALLYIFEYREDADFGLNDNGEKNIFYIEIPDINLAEKDLRDLKLKEFIPGTLNENGVLIPSHINLQNTNAYVDLNDIGYTRK